MMRKIALPFLLGVFAFIGLAAYGTYRNIRPQISVFPPGQEPSEDFQPPPTAEIFPEEVFQPYDRWEEINTVLESFSIEAVFVDRDSNPMEPTSAQEEKMRKSLTSFVFTLDSFFKGTKIGEFLERVEFCEECSFYNWGNLIKVPPLEFAEERDYYTLTMIHEIAHSFNHLENYNDFRLICWGPNEEGLWFHDNPLKDPSCEKDGEAFLPQSLTQSKGRTREADPEYYYSATHYDEDLAESVLAYLVSADEFLTLAQKYPKLSAKYAFIKESVFDEREF